jgi:PKD repeat protein
MDKKLIILVCLVLISSLTVTSAFAQNPESPNTNGEDLADHVPGEVLIRFNPWINSSQAALQMEQLDLKLKREVPVLGVKLVKLPPGLSVEEALSRFNQRPGVEYVEPNYILQIAAANFEEVTDQWDLKKINADQAWLTFSEQQKLPILLAAVDTGIDPGHSDLADNIWYNSGEIPGNGEDDDGNGYVDDTWGWDFVNNDNDPFDDYLHGTAVSGVMAGIEGNEGIAGVCPWCQVMAVKVMNAGGTGTLDDVASGIIYATDAGAKVINLSLAGPAGMQTLEAAVNHAWTQGALVVAGAGNDGANAPMFPAGYANAMAIGATGETDTHACFSNYAEDYISVAAPGENIYLALPGQNYGIGSGTSISSPLVAGLAGLLLSQDPERTNSELRSIIESTAVDLSPAGFDAAFGNGRIDAFRAVTNDTSQVEPPDGLFSTNNSATGYAHSRKLVRANGVLHMIWHTQEGGLYRIRHAIYDDNLAEWIPQGDVFSSPRETYHPAFAADNNFLYVAIPSRSTQGPYEILFTRKSLFSGNWSGTVSLMGSTYDAVRPDLYLDPTNGRLHLVASSLDNAPYVYYLASGDGGLNWDGQVAQVNPSTGTTGANSNTRYASIHANGNNIYIVSRTFSGSFLVTYYMHSVRSSDGGQTWFDQYKISSFLAITSGEYGISLAGVGDRLYMGYEVGSNLYFRSHDGTAWSAYETLELGDSSNVHKWPTITQAEDGQAWLIFEVNGELFMRHYDGSTWAPKESLGTGNYANLKLGTNGDKLEWITTQCNGAPFLVSYDSRNLSANPQNLPPTADFTFTTTDHSAIFTDTSTDSDGTIASWAWDFGDSNNSTDQNPSHIYAAAGTYSVSLTVTDNDGGSDSISQDVTVTAPNVLPTANFTHTTTDLAATFTDTSTDSDGTITSWAWNFGDGNTSTQQHPVHNYTAANTYSVSLTVTDNIGGSDSISQDVTVSEPNVLPAASFTYTTTDLTATFTDTSTDSDGTITSWSWDFDDSSSSIEQNPSHSYAAAGTYTVTLTVTDNYGGSNSSNQSVTVTAPNVHPTANFTHTTTDLTATFTDTSTDSDGTITSWAWNFGDGNTSTQQHPVHNYTAANTYSVSLTVTDNIGGSDSISQDVTVSEPNVLPAASFTYSTTDLSATFTDTSTDSDGTIASWSWNFGDSNNSTEQNPSHSYAAAGTYTVSLTVTDNNGGTGLESQEVTVTDPPVIVDAIATGEIHVAGTVSGDYTNTNSDDDTSEAIKERDSGGKPANRYSYLEHKWIFNVTPGNVVTLYANAWSSVSSDGDSFIFAYSTDDVSYTYMFTVANTSDGGYEVYGLPAAIQGTVYVRVTDSDHTQGSRAQDTVFVDHLYIRTETQPGDPPNPPTILNATAVSAGQIDLTWIDNADDELGYQVERSTDGSSWQVIGTVLADGTSFNDTGLEPDSTYIYRIRAYNATGYSGYSNTDSATTNQASTMHVGDIDGFTSPGKRGRWNATAVVTIHSESESLVEGATATGTWSNGRIMSCTTDVNGLCSFTHSNLKSQVASISFTVTSVTATGWEYNSIINHDVDGTQDSNGTSITIEP